MSRSSPKKSVSHDSLFIKIPLQILLVTFLLALAGACYSQAEIEPWGNMKGIRVGGQLVPFETSLRIVKNDWEKIYSTGKERQRPKYSREGQKQLVTTRLDSLTLTETVQDSGYGMAKINVDVLARSAVDMQGLFFCVSLPMESNVTIEVLQKNNATIRPNFSKSDSTVIFIVKKIRFKYSGDTLDFIFKQLSRVFLKRDTVHKEKMAEVYIPVLEGEATEGLSASKTFTIKTGADIDQRPVTFTLDASKEGRRFAGFGGNFRLQNPKTDPQVIDYSLEHLRVAWSRIELPWSLWQPELNVDPVAEAKNGNLNPRVQKAMEMADRLQKLGIPIILSAWFPPQWAIVGKLNMRPANGVWGNQLDSTRMDDIFKSITKYILYLKSKYGVEISFFSFNESDLGINVRQTGEEHAALIKGLGAYFQASGLKTKMLLGDNSDATTYRFIYPTMHDPEAIKYVGAISFHSWRGWDKEILEKWDSAAKVLDLPLIVGEGSIDAAAWNYPAIFEEQTYALQEINLYVRLLAIDQPLSILQWQLTADYSPLAGGGIFGNDEPLHPTQRFWNFKQLSSTPKDLYAMPISGDIPAISCAALGDNSKGLYAFHFVNNGAGRKATLTGLPGNIKALQIYITDRKRSVKKAALIKVVNGTANFHLDPLTYTSLMTK